MAIVTVDAARWQAEAQPGELAWHRNDRRFRGDDTVFWAKTDRQWRHFGFRPDQFAGRRILDVGAGSRMRGLWFEGAEIHVLEPLAERFLTEVPWCDLDRAASVHAVPAEEHVADLDARFDFVFSLNALDHGYDFAASVRNLLGYLRPGAHAFVQVNCRRAANAEHPLVLNEAVVVAAMFEAGWQVRKLKRVAGIGSPEYGVAVWARRPSR